MSASFLSAMETRADDLYDLRCELGYAQCEECNTWYPQLHMNYDDDTGFHTCVECDCDEDSDDDEIEERDQLDSKQNKITKKLAESSDEDMEEDDSVDQDMIK